MGVIQEEKQKEILSENETERDGKRKIWKKRESVRKTEGEQKHQREREGQGQSKKDRKKS